MPRSTGSDRDGDRAALLGVPAPGARLRLRVEGLAAEGDGVARAGEVAVFVPQTAPGDVVLAEVTESRARYARARVLEVAAPGAERVQPPCPVYAACGGCTWQHITYEAQLRHKRTIVVEALRRLGHVAAPEALVHDVLPSRPPWRYRHKMAVPFAPPTRAGQPPIAGFYAARSHRVVPFTSCAIQHPLLDRALAETLRLAAKFGLQAYDARGRTGCLRHLVARASHGRPEMIICLVTASPDLPHAVDIAEGLMAAIPECVGVVHNVNGAPGNAILGRSTRLLRGRDHIVEEVDGLRFLVSAPSFFQVNPAQGSALYRTAVAQADLHRGDAVLDLYAGVGSLSLFLARAAGSVDAVEEVAEAVRDGRRNAAANGMPVRFHLGRAESVVPALVRSGLRPDVAVLDPPRKGAAEEVLSALAAAAPRRVVYVSCNPATLARDVEVLAASGYRLVEVRPVDMFPQTAHVECSALMERGRRRTVGDRET